jgi:PAS domain-containing protein
VAHIAYKHNTLIHFVGKRDQINADLGCREFNLLEKLSIENAIDGIHVLDLAGNVVDVNAAFCDLLGYSREELLASAR